MNVIKFYNREEELKLLEKIRNPLIAIIYGRRRVGKTTLALKFCEKKTTYTFLLIPRKQKCYLLKSF
jgi:AAA+ ATPase superfamily predicted ATPase